MFGICVCTTDCAYVLKMHYEHSSSFLFLFLNLLPLPLSFPLFKLLNARSRNSLESKTHEQCGTTRTCCQTAWRLLCAVFMLRVSAIDALIMCCCWCWLWEPRVHLLMGVQSHVWGDDEITCTARGEYLGDVRERNVLKKLSTFISAWG